MSSFTSMRWLMIAILCFYLTKSPSCDCSTACPNARSSSLVTQVLPHNPIPSGRPLPSLLALTSQPAIRSPQFARLRRSTHRPRPVVSLARCHAHYMLTDRLSFDRAVSRCTSHRDQAVVNGRVYGSHVLLPPPPTRTLPTSTRATRTTPTPRPRIWRQGAVLADRPRTGVGMVLRDDVIKAVVDSRAVKFGYRLRDSATPRWRKLVRPARVWYRRVEWFVRISMEEEDLRNGNLLGLLWVGSWLVAAPPDELEESESESTSEVVEVAEVAEVAAGVQPTPRAIEWYPAGDRDTYSHIDLHSGPRTFVREDTLTTVTMSTPLPTGLVPPRTRLAIGWHLDQSQSLPTTAPRCTHRPVRPGHSVYQPPVMQSGLTEERRAARSEARRQVLEQVEREAQEPMPAPEAEVRTEDKPRRKKTRGGKKVQERKAAREARLVSKAEGME